MVKPIKIIACAGAVALLLTGVTALAAKSAPETVPDKVGYNQHVRAILSENCFYCHGPDKNHRKAKLRLDVRDDALKGGKSGDPAIVPGKPEQSALLARILTDDADEQMPPPDAHKALTATQREILRKWILQGAPYEPHWAYIAPVRPPVPTFQAAGWVRNPIDAFILKELEARNITPSKEADKRTLLRRLSLDLVGLPPTVDEVNAYLADASPDAYEKQVDRLLASPHYGERMAVPWLDAVRFSDTVGFHGDQNQDVFPYRDYVINAFNSDKPFDQFTIEQLAGDLLPNPTTEQRVATCFNRLNMMTREGGAQDKEYLAKYAADRVRTVSSAFLGSTMACCECHDHKFDPFTAKDFYSLAAFWDDIKQWGIYTTYSYTPNPDLAGFTNDSPFPPEIVVDSPYLHARMDKLRGERSARLAALFKASRGSFDGWKARTLAFLKENPTGWQTPPVLPSKMLAAGPNGAVEFPSKAGANDVIELKLGEGTISSVRIDALPSAKPNAGRPRGEPVVRATFSVKHGAKETKLGVYFADADAKEPIYSNGFPLLSVKDEWRVPAAREKSPHAVYLFDAPLKTAEGDTLVITLSKNALAAAKVSVSPIAPDTLAMTPPHWGETMKAALESGVGCEAAFVASTSPDAQCRTLEMGVLNCRDGKSPVLTSVALPKPKISRVLSRGNWQDETGAIVEPATPAFLTHNATPGRKTRLDLAKWLVAPENPLVSRTFVNRLWKQFLGNGLCGSVEDLGSQGEWPSHPELLDWLAVEFRESGWDVKHIVKLIVTSSAYRQDSNLRPELKDADPGNRLLASQNPRRLEAEFVRDNALAASGLIDLDLGGPSAKPYQPAGYYANIQFPSRDYVADADERQYRRGLYMHWQRTFLHPMLANFDAPSREDAVCTRNVSNTPQQALTLLNDPTFVEAARALAAELTGDDSARLELIYQRVLGRSVKPKESASLQSFLAEQRKYYLAHPDDAAKLMHVGLAKTPADHQPELAAWATVCRVVLNLHETVTRY